MRFVEAPADHSPHSKDLGMRKKLAYATGFALSALVTIDTAMLAYPISWVH